MSESSKLKSKKTSLKSKLSRFKNILDNNDKNQLNEELVAEIECRLEGIENSLSQFSDIILQLLALENANENALLEEEEEFETKYYNVISKGKLFCKIFHQGSEASSVASSISQVRVNENERGEIRPVVRLPPITLPTFNGEYCSWLEFRDSFLSLVDQNATLNDTQRFYYLRSSLEKQVQDVIQSIEATAENYHVAWQLLTDRYENKALMIHNHIQSIFEHPILLTESYKGLRNLYDNVTKHLRSLKSLGENTDSWDRLIIYIIANKFDSVTRRDWEKHLFEGELPTLKDLSKFLKSKCEILEKLEITSSQEKPITQKPKRSGSHGFSALNNDSRFRCYYCSESHSIFKCGPFLKLSIEQRISAVKSLKLCLNCLRHTHPSWQCKSNKCYRCHKAHNTLLHSEHFENNYNSRANLSRENSDKPAPSTPSGSTVIQGESVVAHVKECGVVGVDYFSQVLLSTVFLEVKNGNKTIKCRALLDSGSQSNFITESACKKLNLSFHEINHAVKGIGQTLANISKQVSVEINSCAIKPFKLNISCLVLHKITDNIPTSTFNRNLIIRKIPAHIQLADPNFNKSAEIDLLLGSAIFWSVLSQGQMALGDKLPILQNTAFGWIVAGNIINKNTNSICSKVSINCLSTVKESSTLDKQITRFWELEEVNHKRQNFSESEKYCEKYFRITTSKDKDGRYVVRIPFKVSVSQLGYSRENAIQRFYSLERKLYKNRGLKQDYIEFIKEYIALNHMSEYKDDGVEEGYYLPHHAIVKNTSLTTKMRTVFDASCKTSSGLSLNDVQFTGPTLQQDIFEILLRFRCYKYVMTGDIKQMFRQILINDMDQKYQKIFWRSNPDDDLKCYKLHTVTYGTASAPYLAVKCLFDIADENQSNKAISTIIKRDFYMDDLLTGANTEDEILYIQRSVSQILARSGFELRKWLCNDKELLDKFQVNEQLEVSILNIGLDEPNKTLGIFWNAQEDSINYKLNLEILALTVISKRSILSVVSQIFDPLGLVGPIIITAKLIIQDMWKSKVGWDDDLPENIQRVWLEFQRNIIFINDLKANRFTVVSNYNSIELHGFCDASIKAYGACIYLRCEVEPDKYVINLLCAKSRVAPLKQVSLPRLELCAAHLLANLVQRVRNSLPFKFDKYYYWSDSTITLCWIRGESSSWKTFVANRVSEIQSMTDRVDWYHVASVENPADLLSRGTTPQFLINYPLWWHGPEYLLSNKRHWNIQECTPLEEIPEQKTITLVTANYKGLINKLSNDCSSFPEMLHVLSYTFRFMSNLQISDPNKRLTGALLPEEINKARRLLIKEAQTEMFPSEYSSLKFGKAVPVRSKILSLNPILTDGLICVGGRLRNANLREETKHPIILPHNHPLTKYILEAEHKRLLHCGAQALLYSIREQYWPISGRSMCRQLVNKCLNCFKAKPKNTAYLMADLPETRVTSYGIFQNVGTDYGGPFQVKDRKGRGCKFTKGYICLFVCMSTKALHLELVSDLTTECFLAAFNRFTHRRGMPKCVYSDNGLNYVGANNEINKIYEFLKNNSSYIGTKLADQKIKWHFIPANSPTFGGLWEAGIKSTKAHLKRVIGKNYLTFEEFSTLLVQIEGILNSRPLCPLTEDPEDCSSLTPAHFLIGRTLTALPEHDLTHLAENRLSKWQHIQAMVQHFWKRWSKEYLSELQTRTKWRRDYKNLINIGSLVLVKDDNAPVLQWQLGRVTELHRGSDNVVRVITLRVRSKDIKRAVNRVCVLPIETD